MAEPDKTTPPAVDIAAEIEKAITAKLTAGELCKASDLDAKVDAKVTAGEFIKKTDHAAAIEVATKAGRDAAVAEMKVISTRRIALASANLPTPADDNVLAGDEAAYQAKADRAKARADKLKPFSLSSNTVAELAWGVEDPAFERTVNILAEASKKPAPMTANPFVGGTPPPADKPARPNLGVM